MKAKNENSTLTIFLEGRIDTNNAAETEKEVFAALDSSSPDTSVVILDADKLEYISSAGLRVLMKLRKNFGENISIINASPEVFDIFEVTGFTELIRIEKRFRKLSVDGCEVIGKGFCGTVYRVNDETIVKVYYNSDSLPMIRNEQRLAKRAFVKGIPTAISYDIVKVGENYGSVFELINADTFNEILIKQPQRFDELICIYTDFLKTVHSAEMDPDTLPMARDTFIGYLDVIGSHLTAEQCVRLKELLSALPDDLHFVHGDFQMKNVMLVGNEPMLIDMDNVATGQPIFDFQALYVTYILFGEDDPDNLKNFLGIPIEKGVLLWEKVLKRYFDKADDSHLAEINSKIRLLATVRFLYLLVSTDLKEGELGEKRIRRAQSYIAELTEKVNSLVI